MPGTIQKLEGAWHLFNSKRYYKILLYKNGNRKEFDPRLFSSFNGGEYTYLFYLNQKNKNYFSKNFKVFIINIVEIRKNAILHI